MYSRSFGLRTHTTAAQAVVVRAQPLRSLRPATARSNKLLVLAKQYVPSDGFGGLSPEKRAANQLRLLFTFTAVKIILAQLEGSGRGGLGSYNQKDYAQLSDFLQTEPLRDGDEWIAKLMRINSLLAVRVLEVREAYCEEDFEYDQLQRLARKDMKEANVRLMRTFASASFTRALGDTDSSGSSSGGAQGQEGAGGDAGPGLGP